MLLRLRHDDETTLHNSVERNLRSTGVWKKQLVIKALVLTYPSSSKMYLLSTDASSKAAGAVLSQVVEEKEE